MKLVIAEPGSELVSELWATSLRAASSILCYPEGRAALAAARRSRRLTALAFEQARDEFDALHSELLLVGVDLALARRAGDLAETRQLRGFDAVHLASALALGAETTLVTWDEDLRRAAKQSGCALAPAS